MSKKNRRKEITIPFNAVPPPCVDVRLYEGMVMQRVLSIKDTNYIWDEHREGWFSVRDETGTHGAFCMNGDGYVSLYLKNGEPYIPLEGVHNLWEELDHHLRDEDGKFHRDYMTLMGFW